MTLEKATEMLSNIIVEVTTDFDPDVYIAIKLGIEALKRVNSQRNYFNPRNHASLPGETED